MIRGEKSEGGDDLRINFGQDQVSVIGTERPTRPFVGSTQVGVCCLMVFFSISAIMMNFTHTAMAQSSLFMAYGIFLIFLIYPRTSQSLKRENYLPWYDVVAGVVGGGSFLFFALESDSLVDGSAFVAMDWSIDVILALVGLAFLAEACRRVVGSSLVLVVCFLFVNALSTGRPVTRIVYDLFYSDQGVMGAAVRVCASYIALFMILSALLESIGVNAYFISCAKALVGRSVGGAAKIEVLSSGLCGMVSGSSVVNTVTTGATTVPLMKKSGYSSAFAAAVVAAASIGGQIMPPIMGSAAFLMAELNEISYHTLLLHAMLPAFLYFLAVFLMVHFDGKKEGISGVELDDMPSQEELLNKSYLLLPIVVLVALIVLRFPVVDAVLFSMFICVLLGVRDKDCPLDFGRFCHALERATKNILPVAVACGMAGIMSGIVTSTGLRQYLISAVVSVAGGHLVIALFITMLISLFVGMAVPTIANYVIMASICAPILTQGMGMDVVLANMFVFYFGIISDVTPPVSIASHAAAKIAQSNPWKTSVLATKLSFGAYIIPYFFAFHPSLLLIDTSFSTIVFLICTATVGICGISAGVVGYFFDHLTIPQRCLGIAAGILLILPGLSSDVVGFVVISMLIYGNLKSHKSCPPPSEI